jgi:hypothetical protein
MSKPTVVSPYQLRNYCRNDEKHIHIRPGCAFLVLTNDGPACAKQSRLEPLIRKRMAEKTMRSTGENCSGPPDFIPAIRGFAE